MPESDRKDIEGVNFTRSGVRLLPEQAPPSYEEKRAKKEYVEEKLSFEFKGLIDKIDNYFVLITEDFKTARLVSAREHNYELNISVESAFLGYAYALSLGKSAEFWVQAGFENDFRRAYEEFMQGFSGENYQMKVLGYGCKRTCFEEALGI